MDKIKSHMDKIRKLERNFWLRCESWSLWFRLGFIYPEQPRKKKRTKSVCQRKEKSNFCHGKLFKSQYVWVSEAFWQAECDWDTRLDFISTPLSEMWLGMARHWEAMGEKLDYRAPRNLSVGNTTLQQVFFCLDVASQVPEWLFFLVCLLSTL